MKSQKAVIITALATEYSAVRKNLINIKPVTHHKGTTYECGKFIGRNLEWDILIKEVGQGNNNAAAEVERVINFFEPSVILLIGVAGGIKDVELGDVVVATKVYGYESGKDEVTFKPRPVLVNSSYRLIQRAQAEVNTGGWIGRIPRTCSKKPKVVIGAIAAGEKVITSTKSATFQLIRSNFNDAVAVEMEDFGFLGAVQINPDVEALVVRGISDLIDDKNERDASGFQELASLNASAFAFEVLANYQIQEDSEKKRQLLTKPEELKNDLPNVLQSSTTDRPRPPEVHINQNVINHYLSAGQKSSNICLQVQCSKPIQSVQQLLQSRPPIALQFTLEGNKFWLKIIVEDENIGIILSPFSEDFVGDNDFSYTLNDLLMKYLQKLDPNFLEKFEKDHGIKLENYEYILNGTILDITLPIDIGKFATSFQELLPSLRDVISLPTNYSRQQKHEDDPYKIALERIKEAQAKDFPSLSIDGIHLGEIPEELYTLSEIDSLDLSRNNLTKIPEEIGKLIDLKYLHLDNNKLSTIPKQLFQLIHLTHLYLNDNYFAYLPEEIGQLAKLEMLHLSNNPFLKLPNQLFDLANLSHLYLINNKLDNLPSNISRLKNLTQLFLYDNYLHVLPKQISELTNLKWLGIGGNRISEIPTWIGDLKSLETLIIGSKNNPKENISTLPSEIGLLTNLQRLDLTNLHLSELPVEMKKLLNLTSLQIDGNPDLNIRLRVVRQANRPKEILDYYFEKK